MGRVSLALNPGYRLATSSGQKGNDLVRQRPRPRPALRIEAGQDPRFRALHPHDARIDDAVLDVERATVQLGDPRFDPQLIAQREALKNFDRYSTTEMPSMPNSAIMAFRDRPPRASSAWTDELNQMK